MAPPFDTGSRQVGREMDSPLPVPAVADSTVDALLAKIALLERELEWYKRGYFLAIESRNHSERYPLCCTNSGMPASASLADAVAPTLVTDGPRLLILPFPFVDIIRESALLTNILVGIVRQTIVPEVNGRGTKTVLWSHVKRVMEEHLIIPAGTKNKEFAGAMATIDNHVIAESVRHSCEGCMLPKGDHRTWALNSRDRALCYEVERWLQPLLSELEH